MILAIARKFSGGLCYDDMCSRLMIECVEAFPKHDPTKGSAVTFVYWRARKVRTYMFREVQREVLDEDVIAQQSATDGSPSEIYKRVRVQEILSVATPRQAVACFTLLNGLNYKELREMVNMSPQSRNALLYKLGNSFHKKRRTG